MTHIEIDNIKLLLPANGNDLTAKQLLYLARQAKQSKSIEALKIKFLLFCNNAKIERGTALFVVGKHRLSLDAKELVEITAHLDFLFSEPDENNNCRLEPTHYLQKFPFITIGDKTYCGAANALTNFTYEQFMMLQTYAEQPDKLNHLLSILYTPIGQSYNLDTLDEQAIAMNGLTDELKQITVWFYQGSMKCLARKFPKVFSGSKAKTQSNTFDLQMQLIDHLADGDVTKVPDVRKSLLYDVLYTLNNAIIKNEQLKNKQLNK